LVWAVSLGSGLYTGWSKIRSTSWGKNWTWFLKIEDLVLSDRRMKLTFIARGNGVSENIVWKVLHDDSAWTKCLDFKFQASLRQTKTSQERNFPWKSKKLYKPLLFFFPQIGTGVYHWNPPIKQESMQWVHKVRFPPKKAKTQSSSGKRMATIFWAEEGILLIERR
jgi:hypothetical protein